MPRRDPTFTVGIEEEYLLVNRETRDVVSDPPQEIFQECLTLSGDSLVEPELLRSQIEVDTKVCRTIAEAGSDLARLRRLVADVSDRYGLAPIAASTHPFAHWQQQQHTPKERYLMLSRDMQSLARRMLICGMHVHVGIDDDDLRIDLLNQFAQYLPLLLALSTSSPFWEGSETGLKSYRLPVFDSFPRTGLPEHFASFSDYEHYIGIMIKAGIIKDPTVIWWDLRPSARFPTLEMRITDVCTRLGDAVSLAALTVSTLRMLWRRRRQHVSWRIYPRFLVDQNRWRALRYGLDEGLVDFASAQVVPIAHLLNELLDQVREDAQALGCLSELEATVGIVARGTSAHRQVCVYHEALDAGAGHSEALCAVVDWLVSETLHEVPAVDWERESPTNHHRDRS